MVSWAGKDRGNNAWKCLCDCGNYKVARSSPLGSGDIKSCGCLAREQKPSLTHGMGGLNGKRSPEYTSWSHMKGRCQNERHKRYRDYGARGILVCERWNDFVNFFADMGSRPIGTRLGRLDKAKNYELSNCKWMTTQELKEGKRPIPPHKEQNRQPLPAHCHNGHLFTPENVTKRGTRYCKTCATDYARATEGIAKDKRVQLKREVMAAYGGRCVCCGEDRIEFLAIDHIFNDGGSRRRNGDDQAGGNFYRRLKREGFPKGRLQVLCHNCNAAKGYYGYCPHEVEAKELLGLPVVKLPVKRLRLTNKEKPVVKKRSFRRKLSADQESCIYSRYIAGGITMDALGKEYGVNATTICKTIHRFTDTVVQSASGAEV